MGAGQRWIRAGLIATGMWAACAWAQTQGPGPAAGTGEAKLALEVGKLQLEVRRLEEQDRWPDWVRSPWLQVGFAFLGGFVAASIAAGAAVYNARKARHAGFDEEVLGRRLDKYGEVVAATEALALYSPEEPLTPARCGEMAAQLRHCYFGGVGVLLTVAARNRYFEFVEALARAAHAPALDAPPLADYPEHVGVEAMDHYRSRLGLDFVEAPDGGDRARLDPRVRAWQFGLVTGDHALRDAAARTADSTTDGPWPAWPRFAGEFAATEAAQRPAFARAHLYRDFVFLQTLSSRLRTALSEDLRGRRRLE